MKYNTDQKTGIVLMTYGSAITKENVAEYLNHVYRNQAPQDLIEDFEGRYELVGGSPLIATTKQQASLLEQHLNKEVSMNAETYVVRAGMLHSNPFIEDAVKQCRNAGAKKLIGIILSPQFSSLIMNGYKKSLYSSAEKAGYCKADVVIAKPWPTEKSFISLLAVRVVQALGEIKQRHGVTVPVIFTTHSLPERVVKNDPTYLKQLQSTTNAVVKQIGNPDLDWYTSYQSAGHTPEEWLKPDIIDVLANLQPLQLPAILIAPIQFLADHLEILYDLDVAARQQCEEFGLEYNRIELPNTDSQFIASLANTTRHNLSEAFGL